jgi:hypothetical protein
LPEVKAEIRDHGFGHVAWLERDNPLAMVVRAK